MVAAGGCGYRVNMEHSELDGYACKYKVISNMVQYEQVDEARDVDSGLACQTRTGITLAMYYERRMYEQTKDDKTIEMQKRVRKKKRNQTKRPKEKGRKGTE